MNDDPATSEQPLPDGYRQWYQSCPCCMQDAVPDIKRRLDEEAAAARSAAPTTRG